MFRALKYPSSGARQTAVAASGFRMNVEVEVFSAVVGLLATINRKILLLCHTDTAQQVSGITIRSPSNCHCSRGRFASKPTTAENTSTSTFIRKPEAATAV
jgi:hypothetical protein